MFFDLLTNWIGKLLTIKITLIVITNHELTKATETSLNGKHLYAMWSRLGGEYNSSYPGPKKTGVMLEYVARRFNFTYSYIQPKNIFDNEEYMQCLYKERCDVVFKDNAMTPERYKMVEMIPFLTSYFDFIFQVSDSAANISAIAKPFQWPVWVSLLISTIVVIFAYKMMQRLLVVLHLRFAKNPISTTTAGRTSSSYLYVVGMLFSQGGPCVSKSLIIRIVAGVWCLATFVLVQAYTSLLITHVITPSNPPLIESVYDIAKNSDIKFVVDIRSNLDEIISNSKEEEGIFKYLRDRLNKYPDSRCKKDKGQDCLKYFFSGKQDNSKVVFGTSHEYALDAIISHYEGTKKCDLQLAKETFLRYLSTWMTPKNTPYRNSFAIGILEIQERGFMQYWDQWFRRIPPQCLANTKREQQKKAPDNKSSRLSLKNLSGAFVVLLVGYTLAIFSFICERITYMITKSAALSKNKVIRSTSIEVSA